MERYHSIFKNSTQWDGETSLDGKKVIIYCEQGYGDIIQFSRYFKNVMRLGAYVLLYCPKPLHRLFQHMEMADEFLDKDTCEILPEHDFHVLSMSLPFLVDEVEPVTYIDIPDKEDISAMGVDKPYFNAGIAWEGNPEHSNNCDRSCPLEYFQQLLCVKNMRLFMLQNTFHNTKLLKNCDDIDLCGANLTDFYDTAALINAMDVVITVDTAVMHLAGAMGKPTYGLLSYRHDPRWGLAKWYPNLTLVQQGRFGDWDSAFDKLFKLMGIPCPRERLMPPPSDEAILLTGGIGDVIALESFMPAELKNKMHTIYYATRAAESIKELFSSIGTFPALKNQEVVWDQFDDFFAIYSKAQCTYTLDEPPKDWNVVSDWSIVPKFQEIELGEYEYNGSSFLSTHIPIVGGLELPDDYIVIVPASENDPRRPDRSFTKQDWSNTFDHLYRNGVKGVVLGTGDYSVPEDSMLIDMTNKTSLLMSIAILKGARGYIGIDSCLSVLAAKLFDQHLFVKSDDKHLLRWKHVYYAPKKDFSFIGSVVDV